MAEGVKSGSMHSLKLTGQHSIDVVTILSRAWTSSNVGIFIDLPLEGSPSLRAMVGCFASFAVERAAQKLYHAPDYGEFNPLMNRDGLECLEVHSDADEGGAPTMVRIHLTSKPHKVGGILGKLLARLQFSPPLTALSTPFLHDLPRDNAILQTVARKFCASISDKGTVAIIGGKKTSIKPNFAEKFAKAYTATYRDPEFEKEVKDVGTVSLDPSFHAFSIESESPAGAVVIAQVLSHYGIVSLHGKKVSLTIEAGCSRYAKTMALHSLMNEHRTEHVINSYIVLSKRDVVGGKSLGGILAVAGISCGLPILSLRSLLSNPAIKPEALAKEVAKGATKLKTEKTEKTEKTTKHVSFSVDEASTSGSSASADESSPPETH